MINKKGQTLKIWWEIIVLSLLFVLTFILIFNGVSGDYNSNKDPTFKNNAFQTAQTSLDGLGDDINDLESKVGSGEFEFKDSLIVIATVGAMVKKVIVASLSFLSGNWLNTITSLIGLPAVFGIVLRLLFAGSLIFILIKLIFRFKA